MRTFNDGAGRTWTVALNLNAVKRVKSLLEVNLLELDQGTPPLLTRLDTDLILLCDVIYCVVKPEADALKVSDEDFGRALGGDAILAAHNALMEELGDFFRQLGRSHLAKAIGVQGRMVSLAVQKIERKLDAVDPEAETEKMFEPAKTPGNSSTNSPESSDLTQGP